MNQSHDALKLYPDNGVRKRRVWIGISLIFVVMFNAGMVFSFLEPRETSGERAAAAAMAFGSLAVFLTLFITQRIAYSRRRESEPVVQIDSAGIRFADPRRGFVPWSAVASVRGDTYRKENEHTKAELTVATTSGENYVVDLIPLSGKHADTIRYARERLRESQRVDLYQLRQSGAEIQCPSCSRPTTEMKVITTGVVVFLFLFVHHQSGRFVGCKGCATRRLVRDGAINLLTCHIIWPLWLLIVAAPQAWKLYLSGHDIAALEEVA